MDAGCAARGSERASNPLPLMVTSLAVGATPLPTHCNNAVIVAGTVEP